MPYIGRRQYHSAFEKILEKVGYNYQVLGRGKVLIVKNGRKIYAEVAGKNLPYFATYGGEAFPWETHVRPNKLDKIEKEANRYGAESWIVFCYAILKEKYEKPFRTRVNMNNVEFGSKLVTTRDYRKHMKPRSPSWSNVDLPRDEVLQITCDIELI